MKGTRESLEEGVIEGREEKNRRRPGNGNTSESVTKKRRQQEEESLTVRGGKGLQDKEKLCKVVKKSNMKDCTLEHLLRATKFPLSKANVQGLPLASKI